MDVPTGRSKQREQARDRQNQPVRETRHFRIFSWEDYQRWLKKVAAANKKKNSR